MNDAHSIRDDLKRGVSASRDLLVETTRRLVATPSGNPPGDTCAVAEVAAAALAAVEGTEVSRHVSEAPIENVVARIKGARPGRTLVFNGHLDTYPVGDASLWTVDPLSGAVKDGRIYGRGVSDMKGGIACSMLAFALLAEHRGDWAGELVVTLAGDEETMGVLGTQYLLDTVPFAAGDAMISGDAGSPRVLRFGEKGMLWLELSAKGKAAHGAHVHLGRNAIEALMAALDRLVRLRDIEVPSPSAVADAIRRAAPVSESLSGAGETRVLEAVTVNIGTVEGGRASNLVADAASARLDIRLPAGVTVSEIEDRAKALIAPLEDVEMRVLRRYEPTWTDPSHEIVRLTADSAAEILGERPAVTMRVGASDSRLYRLRGVPSVVCGLTPHNMGGADEYVTLQDLTDVAAIHTLAAFDFLTAQA